MTLFIIKMQVILLKCRAKTKNLRRLLGSRLELLKNKTTTFKVLEVNQAQNLRCFNSLVLADKE